MAKRKPKRPARLEEVQCCPYCTSTDIRTGLEQWRAEPTTWKEDGFAVTIWESQCMACGKAFWS